MALVGIIVGNERVCVMSSDNSRVLKECPWIMKNIRELRLTYQRYADLRRPPKVY
jgi:hypothetical protein